MVEGGIKSAARGIAARAESESIEAPSRYLYLFGGLSARSPFGSIKSRFGAILNVQNSRFGAKSEYFLLFLPKIFAHFK